MLLFSTVHKDRRGHPYRMFDKKAGGSASRPWPFETILISMLLEHEKALVELWSKIRGYEERKKKGWEGIAENQNSDRRPSVCQSKKKCHKFVTFLFRIDGNR